MRKHYDRIRIFCGQYQIIHPLNYTKLFFCIIGYIAYLASLWDKGFVYCPFAPTMSTTTISGGLKIRGFQSRAKPRPTISVVVPQVYAPPAYFGNNPWFGAIKPLSRYGIRHCPPCAWPHRTRSNGYFAYSRIYSGRCARRMFN